LRGEVVRGLTTAAGLWTVAAIGLAVGGGLYFAAGATTAIAFIILAVLKPLENRFFNKNKSGGVSMVLERKMVSLENIQDVFKAHGIKYTQISLSPSLEEDLDEIKITLQKNSLNKNNSLIIIEDLRKIKGVREVNFIL
jgi:putative Mg2+ transporter-C (MgtC) family protein